MMTEAFRGPLHTQIPFERIVSLRHSAYLQKRSAICCAVLQNHSYMPSQVESTIINAIVVESIQRWFWINTTALGLPVEHHLVM